VGGVGGLRNVSDAWNGLWTEALIAHRDGIVGTWARPRGPTTNLFVDNPEQMERWEPWVRAAVLDIEMHSNLYFTVQTEDVGNPRRRVRNVATLWHWKRTPTNTPRATGQRIARIVRPAVRTFHEQLEFLNGYADLRTDRAGEILAQLTSPIAFWSSVQALQPARHRWTLELLETALRLANCVEMRFKHALACRRPHEYSPQVQPIILTPAHGSLPSGHSTEAHIAALVLLRLSRRVTSYADRSWRVQMLRQAARIAVNRTVAGVHFPVDSMAGQFLGLTLTDYFLALCGDRTTYDAWLFDGERYPGSQDFTGRELINVNTGLRLQPVYALRENAGLGVNRSPLLRWLWSQAAAEWY